MLNSFSSCITNAAKKFPRTPEMSMPEMISKPRMLLHQTESTVTFKQLQSFANTHSRWKFNKQMNVVDGNVKLVDFTVLSVSNFPKEEFTIHPKSVKLKRILSIFNFPDKMEGILSKAVFSGFQIHFLSPKSATRDKAHANLMVYFEEPSISAFPNSQTEELNLEDGDSSPSLKTWVSSPWM
jgi:hypothetical protein